jgi:hypothetical protein
LQFFSTHAGVPRAAMRIFENNALIRPILAALPPNPSETDAWQKHLDSQVDVFKAQTRDFHRLVVTQKLITGVDPLTGQVRSSFWVCERACHARKDRRLTSVPLLRRPLICKPRSSLQAPAPLRLGLVSQCQVNTLCTRSLQARRDS